VLPATATATATGQPAARRLATVTMSLLMWEKRTCTACAVNRVRCYLKGPVNPTFADSAWAEPSENSRKLNGSFPMFLPAVREDG
jgi:hypothetical protein